MEELIVKHLPDTTCCELLEQFATSRLDCDEGERVAKSKKAFPAKYIRILAQWE